MQIRDRIKELRRVKAAPNTLTWLFCGVIAYFPFAMTVAARRTASIIAV